MGLYLDLSQDWWNWKQSLLQVPPDFYIPDFDEDEQNPDERVDRKCNLIYYRPSTLLFAHKFPLYLRPENDA